MRRTLESPFVASLAALIALSTGTGPVAHAQTGFGLDSGRATPSDLVSLSRDIATVINAETILNGNGMTGGPTAPLSYSDLATLISIERQLQMLGQEGRLDVTNAATTIRTWWINHVLKAALDIASNPAASCSLAQSMLERLLGVERQAQMLGLESVFGSVGDTRTAMGDMFQRVSTRCLEEAFDECMATGSAQALIMAATSARRQMQTLGLVTEAWDERVRYMLRRCTVYKVIYNLVLSDNETGASTVLDGSYILLLRLPENIEIPTALYLGRWTTREEDPREVQLTTLKCGRGMQCRQSEPFRGGVACGIITRRRNVTEKTFTVEPLRQENSEGVTTLDVITWTRVVFHDQRHREGENKLVLQFLPPTYFIEEKFPEEIHYGALGAGVEHFLEAVQMDTLETSGDDPCPLAPLLVDNDTWVEGAYPVLFKTAHSASHSYASATSNFQIVHRPDLFPADEIRPELERQSAPEPRRTPAQP